MRTEHIVTGEYYHIYSRGVDRQKIFSDDGDHQRFIRGLLLFNDSEKRHARFQRQRKTNQKSSFPLVQILCYALMPNHFHLLLRQMVDGGIAKFMQKLGRGYVAYFNKRYERTGCLWESEYKAVHVSSDGQLLHTSRYIHLNPLKLFFPKWKICGVPNWTVASITLQHYPWSSYNHYLGKYIDPVIDTGLLQQYFHGPDNYEAFTKEHVCPDGRN